jgi:hypothetical protein
VASVFTRTGDAVGPLVEQPDVVVTWPRDRIESSAADWQSQIVNAAGCRLLGLERVAEVA